MSSDSLRPFRAAALWTIAAIVAGASAVAFAESYRALLDWAQHHGLDGGWAYMWPVMIDAFIATGELALFVAMTDRWRRRDRAGAWIVTALGLAASVAGNVGHVSGHDLAVRATAAVPPVVAAGALAVGLGVLKRVVAMRQPAGSESVPGAVTEATAEPAARPAPQPSRQRPKASPKPAAAASPERRKAERLLRQNPGMKGAELGRRVGVDERTGQRWRTDILGGRPPSPPALSLSLLPGGDRSESAS